MPLYQMTEFQRIARATGFTVKVMGDYAYRKFQSPISPMVRLKKTEKNIDGTYNLHVVYIYHDKKSRKEVWVTK